MDRWTWDVRGMRSEADDWRKAGDVEVDGSVRDEIYGLKDKEGK